MKDSIIREIYSDNASLREQVVLSEEYNKMSAEAYKFYNRLNDILNDEQKKIFENFVNSQVDASAEEAFIYFKVGLKIGLRLAMECLA